MKIQKNLIRCIQRVNIATNRKRIRSFVSYNVIEPAAFDDFRIFMKAMLSTVVSPFFLSNDFAPLFT